MHTLNVMATTVQLQLVGSTQRTLGSNPPLCDKGNCVLYKPGEHRCEGKKKEGTGVFLRSVQFHFCQVLLVAAFGKRPWSQTPTPCCNLPQSHSCLRSADPEPASSPPAAFQSLMSARTILASGASVCSQILVVGYLLKASHAEASGTASRHKH